MTALQLTYTDYQVICPQYVFCKEDNFIPNPDHHQDCTALNARNVPPLVKLYWDDRWQIASPKLLSTTTTTTNNNNNYYYYSISFTALWEFWFSQPDYYYTELSHTSFFAVILVDLLIRTDDVDDSLDCLILL
jgi:hypothetical protein